jgi:hypothetical protein
VCRRCLLGEEEGSERRLGWKRDPITSFPDHFVTQVSRSIYAFVLYAFEPHTERADPASVRITFAALDVAEMLRGRRVALESRTWRSMADIME